MFSLEEQIVIAIIKLGSNVVGHDSNKIHNTRNCTWWFDCYYIR
jgi:hypothetical protein